MGLYAAAPYIEAYGEPSGGDSIQNHHFVGPDPAAPRTPWGTWLSAEIAEDHIALRSSTIWTLWQAVRAGVGIGFHPVSTADAYGLRAVLPPRPEWAESIWAVTHVDLHRTAKVQALVQAVRETSI